MHGWTKTTIALGLILSLSACNTTDALTPQADIPNAGPNTGPNTGNAAPRRSAPVSQADAERLASDSEDARPAAPPTQEPRRPTGAQNTLQAQADALSAGEADAAPTAPAASPPASAAAAEQGTEAGSIRFLPIIGAPVQAVTPLSRQLGSEARANGLTIKASGDTSSQHILKGYFSAFSDGSQTTVVYVWDVLDNAGARLHRIQGQDSVPGSGADPWASVPAATMQAIATRTIAEYLSWASGKGG